MKKNKIGIFGGTFDPPHIGHINIAIAAYEKIKLQKIIFIPTKNQTYKIIPKNSATVNQRLKMLYLATKDIFFSEICDLEICNDGINYTFNTICKLKTYKIYKKVKFYFIVGTDMFFNIFKWYRCYELFKLITFIVFPRNEFDLLILKNHTFSNKINFVILENIPFINISSTILRNITKKKFLQKNVYKFIINNKLYLK